MLADRILMPEFMDYYLVWDCPNCDETNYQGRNRTYLKHPDNGLPCIPFDDAACQNFTCEHCQTTSYTGDLELMSDV